MTQPRSFLSYFSRVTSSGRRYLPEIDGLRFFAIITVFLYHSGTHLKRTAHTSFLHHPDSTWLHWFTSRGGMGVDVFFAISGFILALPFAKHYLQDRSPVSLRQYFLRRLTRLEPPYIITLVGFFILQIALGIYTFRESSPHFLASLFYVHNIVYDSWSTINPVAWSLEVEVQFYLLAPLFFTVFAIPGKVLRRSILIALILAFLAFNQYAREWIEDGHLRKSIIVYLSTFGIGILMADIYLLDKEKIRLPLLADVCGIAALFLLFYFAKDYSSFHSRLGFHIGIFLLFVSALFSHWFQRFFRIPVIAVIGGMCYTIYLLHYALIAFIADFTNHWVISQHYELYYLFHTLLFAAIVLFVSAIFFLLIEKPCMRSDWPKRLRQWFRQRIFTKG